MSTTSIASLFPGPLLDAAERFAQDHAGAAVPGDPLRELGWTATLVPEDAGGVAGSLADVAALVEGLAGSGLQLPVIETCAVVPLLLQAAAPDVARRWLQAVAEDEVRLAPLTALSDALDTLPLQARHLDIGYELQGTVAGVDTTLPASHWLVPAGLPDGTAALFLLEAQRLGPPAARYRTMEGREAADFRLQRLAVPEGACIASGAAVRRALQAAEDAALLLSATDTVAAMAALVRHTATHLQERRQFGVPLASFQVLRHRLADMYVRTLVARGLVLHCFQALDSGAPGLRRTLRLAKVSLAESARAHAEAAIQMHGGMGVSEEVLATRLAQRLIASEFRHGDRLAHAAWLLAADASAGQPTHHQPLAGSAP